MGEIEDKLRLKPEGLDQRLLTSLQVLLNPSLSWETRSEHKLKP